MTLPPVSSKEAVATLQETSPALIGVSKRKKFCTRGPSTLILRC